MIGRPAFSASLRSSAQTCRLPLLVGLSRLLLDHFVDLRIAVAIPVQARSAAVEYVEDWIGIRAAGLQVEADGVVLASNLGEMGASLDRLQLAVDMDLLQLVEQDHAGIAIE